MKTINRGWLAKQMVAGLVEARCEFHYTAELAEGRDAIANSRECA